VPLGRPKIHEEGDLCDECGINPKRRKGYTAKGTPRVGHDCNECHKSKYSRPWLAFRGDECELCSYTPLWRGTLDVHHRDGDKQNNDPDNLMTLCASCHRELEATIRDLGDWKKAESWLRKFLNRILD
jgi:hypothetical protein